MAMNNPNSSWVTLCLLALLFLTSIISQSEGIKCPKPESKIICDHNQKFKLIISYHLYKHNCKKDIKKIPIKIKCPRTEVSQTKCNKYGWAKKKVTKFFVKDCHCISKTFHDKVKCPCPKTVTIRHKCKKGDREVTTLYYVRDSHKKCKRMKRNHVELCDKKHPWTPKYACQCYHYGKGNILTFDKRRFLASTDGKCSFLLSRWANPKSSCSYEIYAVSLKGKFNGQLIKYKNKQYILSDHKKLFVNDKEVKVPYYGKKVRVFVSGEYLQFVAPYCNIAVAYNGHSGGYLSVGLFKKHGFTGLCGNCNGNPLDDEMKKDYAGGRECKLVSGKKHFYKCMKHHSRELGHKYCGRLSGEIQSKFLKCSNLAYHFYRGCIKEVCSAWPDKEKMYKKACGAHSIAAEACSDKGKMVLWRSVKFCPIHCGKNKRFVAKMNPCPKTCENYFFQTSKRCFKLPHRNGCDCKPGYVLDGNICVPPTKCKCLRDVCFDRMPRSKCSEWRKQGRCDKDHDVMNEFCRLSCGFCKTKCQDQVSTKVCHMIKSKGKCSMDFYKQMCRLTCFPESCKCPSCKTIRSSCHPKYKYLVIKRICYKLNTKGKCVPLIGRTYETCGDCPKRPILTRTKCDFCKGYRYAITEKYFRDKSKKKMCKSVEVRVKEACKCRHEQGSYTKCEKNTKMIKVIYKYGDYKCQKCVKRSFTKVLFETHCKGSWITASKCNHKTGSRMVVYHKSEADDCKCRYSSKKIEITCKCPKIKRKGPICEGNDKWVYYQLGYRMAKHHKCKKVITKSQKFVICKKNKKVLHKCNRNTCVKTKYTEEWKAQQCQCRLNLQKRVVGKCCCPPPQYSMTPCLGYYKLKKKKYYLLLNNACVERILQRKIRCRCPKKKKFKYCDFRRGHIVDGFTSYKLTKEKTCKKLTASRRVPIECQKVRIRQTSGCVYSHRNSKFKFRKIIFKSLHRQGCRCVTRTRSFTEPCGCKNLLHHKTIPCPKKCIKPGLYHHHCPNNCYSMKKWYRYRLKRSENGKYSKKCIRELVKIERKLCCCKSKKKIWKKCIKHKYIKTSVKQKMFNNDHKCSKYHREKLSKVHCPIGFLRQEYGKKFKNGKMILKKYYGYIKNCKCKQHIKKSLCVWKCPHKSVKNYCDKHRKSYIKIIKYKVARSCHCEPRMKKLQKRIFCPHYIKKIGKKCPKHSLKGYLVYIKKYQDGCKCKSKKFYKKYQCKCPSGDKTKPKCVHHNTWMWKVYFYRKTHKKCHKKFKIKQRHVHCKKSVKIITKCSQKTGILLKFKHYQIIKHCKCVQRSRLVFKGKCHCKNKKNHKQIKCHPKGHKWLKIQIYHVYDKHGKKCIKKKAVSSRPVYCHQSNFHRGKCNLIIMKRKYVKTYYLRKHCRCYKRKRVWYKKCGCKQHITKRKFCDKKKGHYVFIETKKKWIEKANKCVRVVKKRIEPIYCKRQVRIYKSKCNGKYYTEKLVKKFKNFSTCSCKVRVSIKKRNCHCPTIIKEKKCSKSTGYIGKKLIIFKKWDSKKKRCFVSNTKRYYRKCGCPKGNIHRYCDSKWGKKVKKIVQFKLKHGKCIKESRQHKYKIYCAKRKRYSISKCDRKKCVKTITTFGKELDKKHCRCVWRKINVKKCKCCGCPKPSAKTHCYKHKYFKTKFMYFKGYERKCGYHCKVHHSSTVKPFKCKIQLPTPRWTKCNRSSCKKTLIGWKIKVRDCKCHKYRVVIKRKLCCCPHKPKKHKFCKRGKVVRVVKFVKLKHEKCKIVHRYNAKKTLCKKWSRKIMKKCDRKTCKKPVFILRLVLNHSKCKCVKKMSFLYKMPCCCKKKSYSNSYCDGHCHVNKKVVYRFDHHKKSCVKKIYYRRKCTKCPKVQSITGKCNRKTCLKYKYKTNFSIHKCKCIKHVRKSSRVCCCPKPLPWIKQCKGNTIVWHKKYYKLNYGHCEKRIKYRKHEVDCNSGALLSVHKSKCNRHTCRQQITKTTRTQTGCKCGHHKTHYTVKCCCPKSKSKIFCRHDDTVVKKVKSWHLVKSHHSDEHHYGNKCVPVVRQYVLQKIKKCPNKHHVSKCDYHGSKKRTITFYIYKPRHCKCEMVKKKIKKVLCACPRPQKRILKCNKKTCYKKKIFIYFHGPLKHSKKCKRIVRVSSFKCCCKGKKKWSYTKCNSHTGHKEVHTFKKIFDFERKACKTMRDVHVIKMRCLKAIRSFDKGCNKSNGYRIIQNVGYKKRHRTCSCKKYSFYKKKLCSCKHKKCTVSAPKCIMDHLLIKKKICFIKKHKKCVPEIHILKRRVACPRKKKVVHKCSRKSCVGTKMTIYYIHHKCKCIKKVDVKKFTCCCPDPSKSIRCKKDVYEITKVHYKYLYKQKTCKKTVIKQLKPIKCKPKLIRHHKCNKKLCEKTTIIKLFKIINCKCKMIKVKRIHKKCCCPSKRSKIKCYKKYGVIQHVQYKYRLFKGTCVAQKFVEQDKISCKHRKFIRHKCDHKTKKRIIRIVTYKRIGCKCKKTIRYMQTLCACKKPRIVKGKCKHKYQSVYQIEYRLKKTKKSHKCIKTVLKLYSDQCVCKQPVVTKKCHYNQIRIRKVFYQLRKKLGRKFCHMKDTIRYHSLSCPKKQHYITKCKHFKRKFITIFYRMKHCKCIKQRSVKVMACNCHKRNKSYSYCKSGVTMKVREKYYSTKGIVRCLMHSTYKTKSIKCPSHKKITPISHSCNLRKGYGFYKSYLVTWYKLAGCKCIKLVKKIKKLCGCVKNMKKIRCIADDTLKIYRRTVLKAGKVCLPRKEISTRDIQCHGKEREVVKMTCHRFGKHKCYRKILITERWVQNCKCHKKSIVLKQRCCVPKPIKRKFCDAKKGQKVSEITTFNLSSGKVLYHKDDFLLMDKKVIKSTTRQKQNIICPSTFVKENCEKKTGKWQRIIGSYKRIGCSCIKKIKRLHGKCKCPSKKVIVSKCHHEFQTVKSIEYLLLDQHCVRFFNHHKRRCGCPKPISRIYCDGDGRWVRCKTEFRFSKHYHSCSLEKRCVRWNQMCPEPYRIEGKHCDSKTKTRQFKDVSYNLDHHKCKCRRFIETSHQYCSCKHLNRISTKCIDNVVVTNKKEFTLNLGLCLATRSQVRRQINCPSSTKKSTKCYNNPHNKHAGYKFIFKTIYINHNCKCIKKTMKYKIPCNCSLLFKDKSISYCKHHSMKVKIVKYHALYKKKCILRQKRYKKDVVCSNKHKYKVTKCFFVPKTKTMNKKIRVYGLVVKNCKCVWKLMKIYEKICKCPHPIKFKKCWKNKIIKRTKLYFVKSKYGKHCLKKNKHDYEKIKCNKQWKTSKCSKSTCTLYINYYKKIHHNCKCKITRSTKTAKCCCPKPTPKVKKCDAKHHRIIFIWHTFHLRHKQCYKKTKMSSYSIRCERHTPRVKVGKCVKHYKTIYVISKKTKGCKCVTFVKKFKEKCGCPHHVKFHKGKCIGKFAKDTWTAKVFIKTEKRCVYKLIKKRLRRCRCPKPKKFVKCTKHNMIIKIKISYVLKKHSNSCKKLVSKAHYKIKCSIHPRLVHVIRSKCTKLNGYKRLTKKIYKYAKNCKCYTYSKSFKWPCNCKKLHGVRKSVKCLKNKIIQKVIKYAVLKHKKCVWKVKKVAKKIRCHGIRKKVSKCDHQTAHKTVKIYRKSPHHCQCKWHLVKKYQLLCKCPKSFKRVQCKHDKNLVKTTVKYYLRNHKCIVKHSETHLPIHCNEGTKIIQSKCDSFTGFKTIKRIKHRISKCNCVSQSSVRKCRCKCPPNHSYRVCVRHTGQIKTTHVTHRLSHCHCVSNRKVSLVKIKCRQGYTIISKCIAKDRHYGDKYKIVTDVKFVRHGCKCVKSISKHKKLCKCKPMLKKIKKCVHHKYWVTLISKRIKMFHKKKCQRVMVDKLKRFIECPDSSVTKHCNKKTGHEIVISKKWRKVNCKCILKKKVHKRKCKCDSTHRLIRVIKCNKDCMKVKVYKYKILHNGKCIPRYTADRMKCCCPKLHKTKSKCLRHIGMIEYVTKTLKFSKGKCIKRYSSKRRVIKCSRSKRTLKKKLPKGTIMIEMKEWKRFGCKCKIVKKIHYKAWRCPKDKKYSKCVDVPESSHETVSIQHRMMTKVAGCKKLVRVHRIPTDCKPDRTYWTDCKRGKYGFYKKLVHVTYKAHNCKCLRSVSMTPSLCTCDKPKKIKYCIKSKGLQVQIFVNYVPEHKNHKNCIPVKTRQQYRVLCNKHFQFDHRTKCSKKTAKFFKVYRAEKRVGCKCEPIWKTSPCICKCPKKNVINRCRKNKIEEKIIIKWVKVGCNCRRLVSSHLHTHHCPETVRHHDKCNHHNCLRKITTISYYAHHCKCLSKKKYKHVKCCCPKQRITKKCEVHRGNKSGSWKWTKTVHKLTSGKCFRNIEQKKRKIICSGRKRSEMVGPCIHKKQKYVIISMKPKGCRCVKQIRYVYKNCLCLKKSATEVIFLVDQAVSSRHNNFQENIRKFLKHTVKMFPVGKKSYRFALVKYSEKPTIVFNLDNKHNHKHLFHGIEKISYTGRVSNLAKALDLVKHKILHRTRTGVQKVIYIISDGVNHRKSHESFQKIRWFRKHGIKVNGIGIKTSKSHEGFNFLKKLINSQLRHNTEHFWTLRKKKEFRQLPYQILKKICKSACPLAKMRITKCSKKTHCRGFKYLYGYKSIGKHCMRTVYRKPFECCCTKKPTQRLVCIKNHKILIKQAWKFRKHTCAKYSWKQDVSGRIFAHCKPHLEVRTQHCDKHGYKTILTITRKVINCKCHKSIQKHRVLCRCPGSKHIKKCVKHHYKLKLKKFYSLIHGKCIKRKRISKNPIICPKSHIEKSKCNHITCHRKILFVKFQVKNCKCRHITRTIKQKCCCHINKETRRYCKHNTKIYKSTWKVFDKKRKTCVKKMKVKEAKIRCPKKRNIRYTKCNIKYGKVYYKLKITNWKVAQNCHCIKMRRVERLPCQCIHGYKFKKCTKKGIWKKFQVNYHLVVFKRYKKKIGKCIKKIRVIWKRKHQCSHKIIKKSSKCMKSHFNGESHKTIHIIRTIRKGCKCYRKIRKLKKLCKCPKSRKTIKCIKNNLKVWFKVWFEPVRHGKKVKCAMKTKKYVKKIVCPKIHVQLPKCESKHQKSRLATVKVFKAVHCKCRPFKYLQHVKCKSKKNYGNCKNLISNSLCAKTLHINPKACKMSRKFSKYCQLTCRKCTKCPLHSVRGYAIKYRSCLVTDHRYHRKFYLGTLNHVSYQVCKKKCLHDSYCQSFDFYITKIKSQGHCVFHKVNRHQLKSRLFPNKVKFGASYEDLKRFKSKHCVLSEKKCIRKCPETIPKKLGKCKCAKINGEKHCFRPAKVQYYVLSSNHHCLKRVWKGFTPCHKDECNDWKPKHMCMKLKMKGKCNDPSIRNECKKTCTHCKCAKYTRYSKTKCDKSGHRTKISILIYKDLRHNKCVFNVKKQKQSCNVCYDKPFRVVHKCKDGVRVISDIRSIKFGKNKCKVVTKNRPFSCSKCPKQDLMFVTSCNKSGYLTLVKKYSIRIKGCCKYRLNSRKFMCKKCPNRQVRKTRCSEGVRLRHVYYWVRSPHKHDKMKCIRRVYTKQENCHVKRSCHDEMSAEYCLQLLKSGGCHKQLNDAHKLCPRTCGLC